MTKRKYEQNKEEKIAAIRERASAMKEKEKIRGSHSSLFPSDG
jgi:hypothetical protein